MSTVVELSRDNEFNQDSKCSVDNKFNQDEELAKQQECPGSKVHRLSKDEDKSNDDLVDGRYLMKEFCYGFGFDLCFESELKQLEDRLISIIKLSPVVKKQILDDGKSKIRTLMNDLEIMWKRVDMKQQRSGEKRGDVNQNEKDQVPDIKTEFKRNTIRKRRPEGDLEFREKIRTLQEESSLSEAETPVGQLTNIVSSLTMETRIIEPSNDDENLEDSNNGDGPRVDEYKEQSVGVPTTSGTAQQHKGERIIPSLQEVLSNEEEKYPKIESDRESHRESQEVRGGTFLDEWEDFKQRSGVVAMIPREFQTSNTDGSATEDRYEHFLHDGESLLSMEEIRERYTKIMEEMQSREPNVQDTTVSAGKK